MGSHRIPVSIRSGVATAFRCSCCSVEISGRGAVGWSHAVALGTILNFSPLYDGAVLWLVGLGKLGRIDWF